MLLYFVLCDPQYAFIFMVNFSGINTDNFPPFLQVEAKYLCISVCSTLPPILNTSAWLKSTSGNFKDFHSSIAIYVNQSLILGSLPLNMEAVSSSQTICQPARGPILEDLTLNTAAKTRYHVVTGTASQDKATQDLLISSFSNLVNIW
jgi:hypothetical protein